MSPDCAVAASEHPIAAHAVAECAGALLDRGAVGTRALLVTATMPFAGALGDIATALGEILRPRAVAAVASSDLLAGARVLGPAGGALPGGAARSTGGASGGDPPPAGIAAMAIDLPGSVVWRVDAGSMPEHRVDTFAVALCDPFSTQSPAPDPAPGHRSPAGGRLPGEGSGPTARDDDGAMLIALVSGAAAPGGNRLAVFSDGDLREYSDGSVVLGLPRSSCLLLEANGYTPFAEPMQVTAVNGTCVVALDGMPAAEAFESRLLRAPEALESASHVGLRRLGEVEPFSVRRGAEGLECSVPLPEGDHVEPVFRSPEGVARELAAQVGAAGRAILSLSEAGAAEPTVVAARGNPSGEILAEVSHGDHLGLRPSSLWLVDESGTRRCNAPVTALALGS